MGSSTWVSDLEVSNLSNIYETIIMVIIIKIFMIILCLWPAELLTIENKTL